MGDYHVIISDPETTLWRLKPERKHLFFVCVNLAPQSIVNKMSVLIESSSVHKRKNTGDHKSAFREHDDMTGEKFNAQCFSTLSYRRQKCQYLGLVSQRHAHCSNASPAHKSINALIKHISYWIFFQYIVDVKKDLLQSLLCWTIVQPYLTWLPFL